MRANRTPCSYLCSARRKAAAAFVMTIALCLAATAVAMAQTLTVLHEFTRTDGVAPTAGVVMDAAGNLYGTTPFGGASNEGAVYKLAKKQGNWILSPLYDFPDPSQGGHDGYQPAARVTLGANGSVYGTTPYGGAHGGGIVFKLSPPASACKTAICPWTETILYSFTGAGDGGQPSGPVTFDRAGNLYGATYYGGRFGRGVVYELTPSGSGWMELPLYSFAGAPDGEYPIGRVSFDVAGNLYGVASGGGSEPAHCGAVYQLKPPGSGWTENLLYSFQNGSDGCWPQGGLAIDTAGDFYGTTSVGGNGGTVFELTPSGGSWSYALLYTFTQLGPQADPNGDLALDSSGNIYGTTWQAGLGGCAMGQGCGMVFELTLSSNQWMFITVHNFDEADGGKPADGVIVDGAGNLYGTTWEGGSDSQQCQGGDYYGCGVVFQIAP